MTNRLNLFYFVAMIFYLSNITEAHAENTWKVGGSLKQFSLVFDASKSGLFFGMPNRRLGLSSNRWRTEGQWRPKDWIHIEVAYDAVLRIQDPTLFESQGNPGFQSLGGYRMTDLSTYLSKPKPQESVGMLQNLDRLFVRFRVGPADLYVGRQAISWGSGKVINPTDVIAPFSFETLDTENRYGVDAIRLRVATGWMGELDAGFLVGDKDKAWANAGYIRGKGYFLQTDVSLLFMQFQGHALIGWDMARSLGGAGVWLEGALVSPNAFRNHTFGGANAYWRITAGTDYSFAGNLYGFFEYHFNGPGKEDPASYLMAATDMAYGAGKVYLLGKQYGIVGATYQLAPLWIVQGQVLTNLNDGSFVVSPNLDYNLARNVDMSGGLFWCVGESTHSSGSLPVPESEFGMYPDFVYLSIQFFY